MGLGLGVRRGWAFRISGVLNSFKCDNAPAKLHRTTFQIPGALSPQTVYDLDMSLFIAPANITLCAKPYLGSYGNCMEPSPHGQSHRPLITFP